MRENVARRRALSPRRGIGDYCSPGGLTSPSDGDAAIGASGSCQAVPTSRQLPETAAMLTGVVRRIANMRIGVKRLLAPPLCTLLPSSLVPMSL